MTDEVGPPQDQPAAVEPQAAASPDTGLEAQVELPETELDFALEQIETLEAQVAGLKTGLGTRGLIGEAIGITMAQRGVGEEEALQHLLRISSHRNTKLRQIAAAVVAEANAQATDR